jgi:hypothetical protein
MPYFMNLRVMAIIEESVSHILCVLLKISIDTLMCIIIDTQFSLYLHTPHLKMLY